ncbi:MAG: DNA mismatch repair protein MutS [Planctomycetaceae bacterium]|jgi:DNA mismatch repair protein MutS|nr:DNA mismatch repair protein MutS [Planctomycetaceae bacterium]
MLIPTELKLSPMMRQFHEAKNICPEAVLLFRMGDFYETFQEDAKIVARELSLALTSREKGPDAMPMAGFPHHQLDQYLAKLIALGYKVAVCEQLEDPKNVKQGQIVKRGITRIVTAGTVTDETLLDPKTLNYLAAVVSGGTSSADVNTGLAWVELSTGAFYAATVPFVKLPELLARIAPSEILFSESDAAVMRQDNCQLSTINYQLSKRPDWAFGFQTACRLLLQQLKTQTLEGYGFTHGKDDEPAIRAAGAILDYLNETQRSTSEQIDSIQRYQTGTQLEIDAASRRSLEITRTIRGENRSRSLLAVLDKCMTSVGSRLLSEWVAGPLTDIGQINARLDAVEEFFRSDSITSDIREHLRKIYDLQRVLTKVLQNRANPRDLASIGKTLKTLPVFREKLKHAQSAMIQTLREQINPCQELSELLNNALADEIPLQFKDGGFIRSGFNAELDELRKLQHGGKQWIARFQAEEIRRSGIPSLKVGYTSVFGYYIEITNVHSEQIPKNYVRKQTLKNAERYITPELKEYEDRVLTAVERAAELELQFFSELRQRVCERRQEIADTAAALAQLDVLTGLAALARERNYCRPQLTNEPVLKITEGRHPVLDALGLAGTFVPNDTLMDQSGFIQLITGPNMSGKSTFIRQTALLCIMAQIGSFLPAREAVIGICDRIFARVGASDEIARGQSTFMVEMVETARILNQATPQSLVILDEIGRGTSTYDGLSLAWSIAEYLHDVTGCRTLFATHYHELTDLADSLDGVCNLNVAVRENSGEITFLHKIVPGAADKSYGIHVAKIAGVPKEVVNRAKEILTQLESKDTPLNVLNEPVYNEPPRNVPKHKTVRVGTMQLSLFGEEGE